MFVDDVALAPVEEAFYDVVLCLYFTPGNIRDRSEDLRLYSDAYLDRNPRFIQVISRFYRAMQTGGRMFLTLYKDVPRGRGGAGRLLRAHGAARRHAAWLPLRGHRGRLLVRPLDAGQPVVQSGCLRHSPRRGDVERPERHCVAG